MNVGIAMRRCGKNAVGGVGRWAETDSQSVSAECRVSAGCACACGASEPWWCVSDDRGWTWSRNKQASASQGGKGKEGRKQLLHASAAGLGRVWGTAGQGLHNCTVAMDDVCDLRSSENFDFAAPSEGGVGARDLALSTTHPTFSEQARRQDLCTWYYPASVAQSDRRMLSSLGNRSLIAIVSSSLSFSAIVTPRSRTISSVHRFPDRDPCLLRPFSPLPSIAPFISPSPIVWSCRLLGPRHEQCEQHSQSPSLTLPCTDPLTAFPTLTIALTVEDDRRSAVFVQDQLCDSHGV